jgi:DNA-directed RNA polymerase specialized sigma24 family protein
MLSHADIAKALEDRGARYCITGTIRPGEFAYSYADTGEQAEKIRVNYQDNWRYYNLRIHPPVFDEDLAAELTKLGEKRAELKRTEQEVTSKLRATVLRAAEHSFAEADIARRANVDRMTVRKWLGKA